MRSPSNGTALKKTVILAIFAAVAVVLGIVESLIPIPMQVPGAKLGLGNIMILTCLVFFKGRDAFTLVVLKTVLTSFILGTFSTFLFSFFGALFSFVIMYLLLKLGKEMFSLIGVSVAGGIMHNIGQLTAATFVLGTSKIFFYLPFLVLTGIVTGVFVGLAAKYLVASLQKQPIFEQLER
jgi:heptaprenyl diphosphate synthase